jgi:dolichol-phosphate mannosyltransferase
MDNNPPHNPTRRKNESRNSITKQAFVPRFLPLESTLSLIIPVLNHEPRLEDVLGEIESLLTDYRPELVLVYDVTRPELLDTVSAEQRELEERYGARYLTRTERRGFGSALRAGFEASSGDVIIPIMGDCSDDIAAIPRMLTAIERGADLVAGARYMPGGGIVGDDAKQHISRYYSKIIKAVSSVSCDDVSNSFRAYRRAVWENISNESNSFDISVEMTVKAAALGYRIDQVPAVWTNRAAGQSHFSIMRELPNYGRWVLYAARHAPSRFLLVALPVGLVSLVMLTGWMFGLGRKSQE